MIDNRKTSNRFQLNRRRLRFHLRDAAKKCKKLQTVCAILRAFAGICTFLRPLFFFGRLA